LFDSHLIAALIFQGGSETFHDKQEHFFKELREFHRKHPRDKLPIKITRDNIIESVSQHLKAFKNICTTVEYLSNTPVDMESN